MNRRVKFKAISVVFLIVFLCGSTSISAQEKPNDSPTQIDALQTRLDALKEFEEEAMPFLAQTKSIVANAKEIARDSKAEVERYKTDLHRIKSLLEQSKSTGSVAVNGRDVSAKQLAMIAENTVAKLQAATASSPSLQISELSKRFGTLESNLSRVTSARKQLEQKIELLEAQSKLEMKYRPTFEKFDSLEARFSRLIGGSGGTIDEDSNSDKSTGILSNIDGQ